MKFSRLFRAAPVLLTGICAADPTLPDCQGIDDDASRLACYDDWFAGIAEDLGEETHAPRAASDSAVEGTDATADSSGIETFGAERLPPSDVDHIEARLLGEFNGWDGNTVFRLDNGQVWQQTRNYIADYTPREPIPQPHVTIERGMLGTYNLQVEGVKRIVQVKRIK
jgi:hypothetical protein